MQIIFLSEPVAIGLCFIVWGVLQTAAALVCFRIPDSFYNHKKFPFKPHGFERDGAFYEKWFRVHKWKKYLPDGSALMGGQNRLKYLTHLHKAELERFLVESCRAEMIHALGILPFWVFGFFTPPRVILYMLVYALAVNVPCMMAQRYNRPRVAALIARRYGKGISS